MVFYMHLLKCHSFNLGPNKKNKCVSGNGSEHFR